MKTACRSSRGAIAGCGAAADCVESLWFVRPGYVIGEDKRYVLRRGRELVGGLKTTTQGRRPYYRSGGGGVDLLVRGFYRVVKISTR